MCQSSASHCQCPCLEVSLSIAHPHECVCSPSPAVVSVQTGDVVNELLKYNSNLVKYLHKYQPKLEPSLDTQTDKKQPNDPDNQTRAKDSRSIVEVYDLNYLLPPETRPAPKPAPSQPENAVKMPDLVEQGQQTSPRNKEHRHNGRDNKPAKPRNPDEQKLNKHMKELSYSSRYLSNTGFKKYFGREIFENYGCQNTTGVADGIIYNNYLKTHNIGPHVGLNHPLAQETHSRPLLVASPHKYEPRPVPSTHYGNAQHRTHAQGYHMKPLADLGEVAEQSKHYHDQQHNYTILSPHKPPREYGYPEHLVNNVMAVDEKRLNQPILQYVNPGRGQSRVQAANQNRPNTGNKVDGREGVQIRTEALNHRENLPFYEERTVDVAATNRNNHISQQGLTLWTQGGSKDQVTSNKQQWAGQDEHERMAQKRKIIQECYKNAQVAEAIEQRSRPACAACQQRRYSKCCCSA